MTTEAPGAEGLPSFGRWLARERELRGLGREEVAQATKLAPGVVEALESGEAERMPPRAYLLGYLRSYAGAIGLDPDEVVLRYEEAAGPVEPSNGAPRRLPVNRAVVVAVVLGLVAVAALAWGILRG